MKLSKDWVVGFVDGEGCFHVGINAHKEMSIGYQVLPEFTIVQHQRDVQLLYALKEFFGCGVVRRNHGDRLSLRVRGLKHLQQIVVPFFVSNPLQSRKRADFDKFRSVVELMANDRHLALDGLAEIRRIAKQMNRGNLRESPATSET
jgi:hypothetical protein